MIDPRCFPMGLFDILLNPLDLPVPRYILTRNQKAALRKKKKLADIKSRVDGDFGKNITRVKMSRRNCARAKRLNLKANEISKLEITNNDEFHKNYNLYEKYRSKAQAEKFFANKNEQLSKMK